MRNIETRFSKGINGLLSRRRNTMKNLAATLTSGSIAVLVASASIVASIAVAVKAAIS